MFILKTIKRPAMVQIYYRVNYIFLFAELSGGFSCYILTHCCQIVSSMIAKSHDTNYYKILGAKRNDKNIRLLTSRVNKAEKSPKLLNPQKQLRF
jgi:hypothetical protein